MIAQFKSKTERLIEKLAADSQRLLLTCAEERRSLCAISKAMSTLAVIGYRSNFVYSPTVDECLDAQIERLFDAAAMATPEELPEITQAIRAVATERFDL